MVVVRPVLIVKAVVLASVFIAAGGAAIVLGVAQKERLSAVAGIEKTKIPQPPPGVRSDALHRIVCRPRNTKGRGTLSILLILL